ncbi:prolyl oligopeptidase family serine peptidase [Promicromonospora thailandica]|uniref:Peptidase n=1 Tax=Promicromonospora thailandica TaxID=765201 RepID=A0A9X2K0N0_9MICO|nr:prolyl oligopeptidase family serine peptidase [Promicromonospora thailandica]MCP2267244.1 putative peptidase [Promicromonospora thailandica]
MRSTPISRRSLLASGAAVGASALLGAPTASAAGHGPGAVLVTPVAEVLDSGEQVTSVVLSGQALHRVERSSVGTATFTVHVRATNPLSGDVAYEQDRTVTAVSWTRRGEIVLELEHGWGVPGGDTLQYMGQFGRNVVLDLEHTITQTGPLRGRGGPVVLDAFREGRVTDPEVDAFSRQVTASGLNYRLFSPARRGGRRGAALVVWLHGGGEGGLLDGGHDYYDNETPLRANRGALGFATPEAQRLFGGAYVLAPQATSAWMLDGDGFTPLVLEAIREVAAAHRIDPDRVHVVGCSNGGYMSLKMVAEHPGLFATSTPICCGIGPRDGSGTYFVSDAELAAMTTPTWLVASSDDTTLDPEDNTLHAHGLIDGSIMTMYDGVTRDGNTYPGHWSWIYVARNDPRHHGRSIWEWMARTRR